MSTPDLVETNVISMQGFVHQRALKGLSQHEAVSPAPMEAPTIPVGIVGDPEYRPDAMHVTAMEYPKVIQFVIGLTDSRQAAAYHSYDKSHVERVGDGDLQEGAENILAEYRRALFCDIVNKRVLLSGVRPNLFVLR